MRLEKKNLNPV